MNMFERLDYMLETYFDVDKDTFLIITGSYNKGKYVLELIDSVIRQTYQKYVLLLVEMSTDNTIDMIREKYNLKHQYCEFFVDNINGLVVFKDTIHDILQASGQFPIAFYHNLFLTHFADYSEIKFGFGNGTSDDDLMNRDFLLEHYNNFKDPNKHVSICNQSRLLEKKAGWVETNKIAINNTIYLSPLDGSNVDGKIDGNQISYRFNCLKDMPKPIIYTMDDEGARHSDGMFLTKLNRKYRFYPVTSERCLSIHRTTFKSHFDNANDIT